MIQMTPNLFRGLVIASFVAGAAGLGLDIALSPPSEAEPAECDLLIKCIGFLAAVLVIVFSYFAAVIGLLWFRWWARPLYLWGTCLSLLLIPFLGNTEVGGPADALFELTTLLEGAVIAAAYWSSISGRFARPARQQVPA